MKWVIVGFLYMFGWAFLAINLSTIYNLGYLGVPFFVLGIIFCFFPESQFKIHEIQNQPEVLHK